MDAVDVTRGLKLLGFGTRMWVGVLLLMLAAYWFGDPNNRQRVFDGLFGGSLSTDL
jgi:hypothetical protein